MHGGTDIIVSVIVDKESRKYKGFGSTQMRGFIIVYSDIRNFLRSNLSIREVLLNVIQSANFVGEDLPEADALKILDYLDKNNVEIFDIGDKLIYIVSNGNAFLEFFEKILRKTLIREYTNLRLRRYFS